MIRNQKYTQISFIYLFFFFLTKGNFEEDHAKQVEEISIRDKYKCKIRDN